MTRRRLVALVSAAVLVTLGLLVFATGFFLTHTEAGRGKLHDLIQPWAASKIRGGSLYVGRVSGSFINGIVIDSVAIRDKQGELFASTGRVTVEYNWRDLADNRIFVRRARIEHPYVHLVQHANGQWNYREIFASDGKKPNLPKDVNTRNLGDYIVIDSTYTRDATFLLTMPWRPDDTLRGSVRDSVIRAHLNNPAKVYAKAIDGYARTYAWRNAHGLITHARLADPDSDRAHGQLFKIDTLSVDEFEPTFKFRRLTAEVRHLGDSLWLRVPHFEMPASNGVAHGKVWWGKGPMQYDIAIHSDSVALDDVNWVYPTLPRVGGGKLDLVIRNDPKDPHIIDYKLVNMDVRTTKSRLTGNMSFGVGAPILLVRDVNVVADPVDFDLVRTLNGKPLSVDWQGRLFGTVKGRGGPLTRFVVDDARGRFEDAHVPGAVSRFTAKGGLDILYPAFTAFRGFDVDVSSLDLRSIEYLFPAFPRLGGTASGTARLDSSWLDVRFSDAHIVHQDGPGEPSRASGSGRITYGEKFMSYDVAMNAEALSLPTLSRSYPGLPSVGVFSGPIRAKGSSPDLELATSLQGTDGAVSFDGRIDIDSIGGYGAHGRGQFSALNLVSILQKPSIPTGPLSGHYDVDLVLESASSITGSASLDLDRTTLDSLTVYPSRARLRFADGRMLVDSLFVRTAPATLTASGAIGLPKGAPDSLRFSVVFDSLGGLRSYISHPDTTLRGAATPPDSLAGTLKLTGVATGMLDSLHVRGDVEGRDLLYTPSYQGRVVDGTFNGRYAAKTPSGAITLSIDTASVLGIALDSIGASFRLDDATHARFSVTVQSQNGPSALTAGAWNKAGALQSVVVDTMGFVVGDSRWRLVRAANFTTDSIGARLDSLLLRNQDSASIAITGNAPRVGSVFGELRASRIPLHNLSALAQLRDTLVGVADLNASVTGTREQPQVVMNTALSSIKWRGVDIDRVAANAQYRDQHITGDLAVVRGGQTAVTAGVSLPYTLTLFSIKPRNDSLTGFVRADSTDLSIIQTLLGGVKLSGRLAVDVTAGGTMRAPVFGGSIAIRNGVADVAPLGVTLTRITGGISGAGNSLGQDSVSLKLEASTEGDSTGTIRVDGSAKNLWVRGGQTNVRQPITLTVGARSFHAFDKRSLADVYLTTTDSIRLTGTVQSSVLTGALRVDRGAIFLADPDLARKRAVQVFSDTVKQPGPGSLPAMLSTLMSNLQVSNVTVSIPSRSDFRLRSAEANVRLEGELQLVPSIAQSTRRLSTGQLVPKLALEGSLRTIGGTYNLNLGLVQREFQVLSDGTVTFNGTIENPNLDIRAQYNVPQYRDRDLGIIVRLHGPLLPYPVIDFASNADYEIATSDLLSYLLTGKPGFDFGQNRQAAQVISSFLAPTVSVVTSDLLRQTFGSWFSMFQFQLGTAGASSASAGNGLLGNLRLSDVLFGSTIGAEKQFSNNLFLNVNTGLCQFERNAVGTGSLNTLVGAKVEYRFSPKFSTQLAYDPPTLARTCGQAQSIIGLVPTPGQFSLGFFHTWRF